MSGGNVPRRFVNREDLHRRRLLLGAVSLILLPTFFIVAHHLSIDLAEPFPAAQHVLGLCMVAIAELLNPVHRVFHLMLALGFVYAIGDRVRALLILRRTVASLETRSPAAGDPVWNAAVAAGADPVMIRVSEALPNPAFTAGTIFPRIFVAADLASKLSHAELTMVLAHELAHVRRRDPLRLSVYRFLSRTFFWIPALGSVSADIADEAEIEADDVASRGNPLVLASAILRLAESSPASHVPATVGIGNPDLLDRRIRRLAGEVTPLPSRLSRKSLATACFSIALVFISSLAAAQVPGSASHCRHVHELPLAHLFCDHAAAREPGAQCPHGLTP